MDVWSLDDRHRMHARLWSQVLASLLGEQRNQREAAVEIKTGYKVVKVKVEQRFKSR